MSVFPVGTKGAERVQNSPPRTLLLTQKHTRTDNFVIFKVCFSTWVTDSGLVPWGEGVAEGSSIIARRRLRPQGARAKRAIPA